MAAEKLIGHDLLGQGVIQTKGIAPERVNSTEMAALAADYVARGVGTGVPVYNTTDNRVYYFNGTAFDPLQIDVEGDIKIGPGGIINSGNAATVEKKPGLQYVVSMAGTLGIPGYTILPSANVDVGDMVLFTGPTEAYVIERNAEQATEELLGLIRLASQVQVDAGMSDNTAVTPKTLKGKLDPILAAQAAKDGEQDGRLSAAELRLDGVEAKNVEQDSAIAAIEAEQIVQNNRLDAVELHNTEQDARLTAAEARITDTELRNTEQDGRLAELEATQTKQYFTTLATLPVGTTTITHGLMLSNKDAFVIRVASEGSDIGVDIDSTSPTVLTISTLVPFPNVTVYVSGQ